MKPNILSFIISSCLIYLSFTSSAQSVATVKQGQSGIFIFMGKEIPSGKTVTEYKIERSEDKSNWKQVAEVKTPTGFDAFNQVVAKAKAFFPSQPLPNETKLRQLYERAVATGNTDSLRGMRLQFPVRVALGIMYYDTTASKNITYTYRINAIKPQGKAAQSYISDTISLPFHANFDTITYFESSYNINSLMVKWRSVGKNPAPLFMVYKFRYGAPVVAYGSTSRYNANDTSYYVYYDTAVAKEAVKDLQYFVSPYDLFGNSGKSSQVAVITQDNFNKATFVRNHVEFNPKLWGVQVCWHFTDPVTVKAVEIYRSENEKQGFRKLAEATANDTTYLDKQIWPEKTYFYYVQVVAKAGKRTKQSEIFKMKVPGIVPYEKLNAPVLRKVSAVNNSIRLLIEVNDTSATDIRVYRGLKGGLVTLPELLHIEKSPFIVFMDTTLLTVATKDVIYAVRNEKNGSVISSLSEESPVATVENDEPEYFYAFPSGGKIELYWDDIVKRSNKYVSYTLARQYGPANSKSPVKVLAEKLTSCSYTDTQVQSGNQLTYILGLTDKQGNCSEKTYKVSVQSGK